MLLGFVAKCWRCDANYYPYQNPQYCPQCEKWYEKLFRKGWKSFVSTNYSFDTYLDNWYT